MSVTADGAFPGTMAPSGGADHQGNPVTRSKDKSASELKVLGNNLD
jgi:hypothetical protein